MLDFGWSQMALIAVVALIVLGPKELPKVIRTMSEWVGKARGLAREFRSSVDDMVRESDIKSVKDEFEQAAWKAEQELNKDIVEGNRDILGTAPIPTPELAGPEPYTPPEWEKPLAQLRPLGDHERRKKGVKQKDRPTLKPRALGAPSARTGAAAVRRKVRA